MDYKYKIVTDENGRKGIEFKRETMYLSAWFDNNVSRNRWDPNVYGKIGNSISAEAVESKQYKFFVFDVLNEGVFKLEKSDLLEFYKEHPLNIKYISGKKRMIFPVKLWKKIPKLYSELV
jgi:hypothetical protein